MSVEVKNAGDPTVSDGRLRRGQAKRDQILSAALRVIDRSGVAGASQRAVAAEAGVSPTLIVYHFETVENMLAEALTMANNQYLVKARAVIADGSDPLEALAGMIAESAGGSGHFAVAELSLHLRAAVDPRIRRELELWWKAVDEMVASTVPDPTVRRAVIFAADGMFLRQVVPGQVLSREEVLAVLTSIATA